ncbi:class I SAM-dependent methyltransferase [Aspergillus clavatus NRRL 1]|uniref:Methyltransferase domain-containing protein n=1 Tax=Aspergillus clavatus (strain ATCC 1007 / CBS 513.65 / DSM 816 / NCTC 3887 / NRRL 1 / QM 1276 / 107) TaxID=344612 RepID=A1CCP9_ASPCL|nr:uncharacterized protein ACLA_062710 [Aspergillus clavatus NRRL 1]EAW12306.1 conserved hypothetical protein [Aspergillus clavatus NRRL 1]
MSNSVSSGFHLADGNGYMLDKGYAAACRLNLQFYLWKDSLNFNIHPSIPLPPPTPSSTSSPLRIADLACGTGLWLTDLARSLPPQTTLDGFDLFVSKFPPSQWLPNNVTLSALDILGPVPEHLVGKYDVIHLRLLILVVENSDPTSIIQNVHRMLKPGGYIQWDDLNYPDTHIVRANPALATPAFDRLREFVYSGGRHDWVLQLPSILEQNGFEDAQLEHFQDHRELTLANGEQHLMTMDEFTGSLYKKEMVEEARGVEQMVLDCCREAAQGVALSMPRVVAVARKKSEARL